jgi:hypothetical protein
VSNPALLAFVDDALSDHFGHRPARASVSFLGVDPIEILRFEPIPGERAYVSLGMSSSPMTGADALVVSSEGPRAELMLHVRDEGDRFADIWRRLALLAASPAVEGVVYKLDMTVDLGEPLVDGTACTGGLVVGSALAPIDTADGPVTVFQLVPATQTELAWARVRGGPALRERWTDKGTDLLDLARKSVDLGS